MPVESAHWERAKELDFGVDMNLLNQVNVVFDYFHNKRDRILLRRGSWPQIMGYWNATPWSNIGKVDNKGFELSVNWRKNLTKDFHIDLRGNLTYNQNKYVYVDDPNYPYVWQTTTGKPLSRLTGYIAEGLFQG
jgi:outer membrane receptor protein involved in Fe transport